MFLKNLRNVSPHGIRHGAERLCGVLFRVEKRKNRGAGSRHSGTGAECLQGFSDFRIDPYSNGLQIVSADRLGPLIAELLRKRRNFQGFRVSCQGWMLKNQRCSGGLRRHDDCRPGRGDGHRPENAAGALRKGVLSEEKEGDVGTERFADRHEFFRGQFSPQSLLSPIRVLAQSLEPPPMPAPAGMRFFTRMRQPSVVPLACCRARAARTQRSFSTSPTTSPVRVISPLGSSSRTMSSHRSISTNTDSSRCMPSERCPTTCRKRLSLAGALSSSDEAVMVIR